jgi:putative NADH-flavin reductase
MRLFVLGATGRTGVELVDLGLARGHDVTAFVRSPRRITRADARLHVHEGDPLDASQMAAALAGHDAVLSALGPTPGEAMAATTLLQSAAASTLAAMAAAHVRRFLVVSSALLFPGGGLGPGFFRWLIRNHLRDAGAMEAAVEASAVDWTIARPPRLVATRDEGYRAQDGALPDGLTLRAKLSWRAVAAFLLDAVDDARYVRKVVGIRA